MAKRVRRAWSIKSIPKWADFEKINEVYDYAKSVGKFVDHIVPQRSWLVCGLHSHHNVEPIDPHWNRAKSDRFWPDMPTYSYEDILELRSIWESQNLVLPDKKK